MKRELLDIQRYIIEGKGENGFTPFSYSSYTAFARTLLEIYFRASSEEEKALCLFLRDLAIKKSLALEPAKKKRNT